jgi:phosphate transport system substrate-binding protein
MKNNKSIISILFLILLGLYGCNRGTSPSDTPTTGDLTISVDETYKPLLDSEVNTFNSIYKYARVKVDYKSEADVFNDLMNDTIRTIVVPRKLNAQEIKEFEKWEIVPKVTKIAYDAIALIGSKDLKDTTYTIAELTSLLSAEVKNVQLKKIIVVFDNNNSSTIRFLSEKTGVKQFSSNCYALNSSKSVLDYVSKEKDCIGIIGVNWISDPHDTTNLSFLKTVKVLGISSDKETEALKPYQAYIAQKKYPLWREVYIISKEAYTGLGTGFTAFVASERGQRIVLKFGLVPATMPVRLVEINNENL